MEIIIHRINLIKDLKKINYKYGVEVDVRSKDSNLILNHDPFSNNSDLLEDYLNEYKHGTIIFNIKEAGIEDNVIKLAMKNNIQSFFLLDVEMPYLFTTKKNNKKNIAIRFSEYEPIELAKNYINLVEWIWIDTVTKLPVNEDNKNLISKFKSCLVCPERWGRKEDINIYIKNFKKINFIPDAVMTNLNCVELWENNFKN